MGDQESTASQGTVFRCRISAADLELLLPISSHEVPNQSSVLARQDLGHCHLPADSYSKPHSEKLPSSEANDWSLLERFILPMHLEVPCSVET